MKDTQIRTFENPELGAVKGFMKDGELWFVASHVCKILGLKDVGRQVKAIQERFKIAEIKGAHTMRPLLQTGGGKQSVLMVSESVLYELIFQSRKQRAIKVRAWVTTEVLPALRKHGEYRMQGKMFRRSLTDAIQASGENERMHGHAYSTYTRLVYKSLGLPPKVDRDTLDAEMIEKIANRENTVNALLAEGKQYDDIKAVIASWGIIKLDNPVNV